MRFLERLRATLNIGCSSSSASSSSSSSSSATKFDFPRSEKWLNMGKEGYQTEGFAGHYICPTPSCPNKILAYRSIEMTASSTKDYLRFEQPIASGSGRIVMQVPITFEAQFTAMAVSEAQSACASPSASPAPHKTPNQKTVKTRDTHCVCPVVREEFFATCRCTSCGETLAFYHQVKACTEGEPGVGGEKKTRELRWFLARKEQKLFLAGEEGVGEDEQVGV